MHRLRAAAVLSTTLLMSTNGLRNGVVPYQNMPFLVSDHNRSSVPEICCLYLWKLNSKLLSFKFWHFMLINYELECQQTAKNKNKQYCIRLVCAKKKIISVILTIRNSQNKKNVILYIHDRDYIKYTTNEHQYNITFQSKKPLNYCYRQPCKTFFMKCLPSTCRHEGSIVGLSMLS